MTQGEFAELFEVDVGTVSRWETGRLHPSPNVWKRIRNVAHIRYELVEASPVMKYVVPVDDLFHPYIVSSGLERSLKRLGLSAGEMFAGDTFKDRSHATSIYPVSGYRAMEIIQADPRWLAGSIAYAEGHCVSVTLGNVWCYGLVAPIPDTREAVMEWCADPSTDPEKEGFWVRLVPAGDLPRLSRQVK
jgi:hypothetical protein